jgi:hypothetical protein
MGVWLRGSCTAKDCLAGIRDRALIGGEAETTKKRPDDLNYCLFAKKPCCVD